MNDLIGALKRLKVNTNSLACLGCGHEHNCSVHGCAIIRAALEVLDPANDSSATAYWEDIQGTVRITEGSIEVTPAKKRCSRCKKTNKNYAPPFCPHCGAKMLGTVEMTADACESDRPEDTDEKENRPDA